MGWTDNREQGLTGRKRPRAPRSSQLQTSITMIIYPVLTKCTGSMFHQRPVNRHCLGKFMGTGSQGQVGKQASHWWFPSKGGKKQRKEKSVFCIAERTIYYRAFAEDSICCPAFFFFFLSFLPVWMRNGGILTKSWLQGTKCHGPIKLFGALEAVGPNHEYLGVKQLCLPLTLVSRNGETTCLLAGLQLEFGRITKWQSDKGG